MPAKAKTSQSGTSGARFSRSRTTRTRTIKPKPGDSTDSPVQDFLRDLDHPLKPIIESVRQIILGASTGIYEDIKWNAPSYGTTEHFATFNLARAKDQVMLILHTGAKPRHLKLKGRIADPAGLLKWLADDRCLVTFGSLQDVETKRTAFVAILREWIRHM